MSDLQAQILERKTYSMAMRLLHDLYKSGRGVDGWSSYTSSSSPPVHGVSFLSSESNIDSVLMTRNLIMVCNVEWNKNELNELLYSIYARA